MTHSLCYQEIECVTYLSCNVPLQNYWSVIILQYTVAILLFGLIERLFSFSLAKSVKIANIFNEIVEILV